MRLINFGMISLTLLTLTGCSSLWSRPEPQIQVVTNTVRTTVPIVTWPKQAQLNDVKIYVVSKENYEEFVKEFEEKNGGDAYIAISIKDYENLALNFAELRRYIEQQKQIILYYEEAVKPDEPTPQKE